MTFPGLVEATGAEPWISLPPVDAYFPGRVERGYDEPQFDGEQLDVEQVDLDVVRDHKAFVEHPFQDVAQVGRFAAVAEARAVDLRRPRAWLRDICGSHLMSPRCLHVRAYSA